MATNLFRKVPGKDSLRMKRHSAAWDDEYLVNLIAAQIPSPDSLGRRRECERLDTLPRGVLNGRGNLVATRLVVWSTWR
jgi:hypothetical protein